MIFLSLFYRRFTPESRDRAICHAIVLGLLVNNHAFEFNALANSAKKASDGLKKLVTVTGAHLATDPITGHGKVVLRLPLAMFDGNRMLGRIKKKK